MDAAKKISKDAAAAAVLSRPHGIFALKEEKEKTSLKGFFGGQHCFTSDLALARV